MKSTIFNTFLLLIISYCFNSCSTNPESENKNTEEEYDSTEMNHLKKRASLSKKEWSLISDHKFAADSLFQLLNPDSTLIGGKFNYTVHPINLDSDPEQEFLLEFGSEHRKTLTGFLFLFDQKKDRFWSKQKLTFEDLYDDDWKVIPELKMAFMKFRVHGTCDDGFIWTGFKLLDNNLQEVVSTYGEHEGNSCGTYTEKDDAVKDFEIHSKSFSELEAINAHKFLIHVRFSEWIADEYMDTSVEFIIPETKITLTYTFNPELKKFECFNSRGEKLFEDGFMGLSFELKEMYKKGKL